MKRIFWWLAIALVVALATWWSGRVDVDRPIDVPATAPASDVAAPAVMSTDAPVSSTARQSPDAGPNSATAQWLRDSQRRGANLPPLPYPIDASLDRTAARALYRKAEDVSDCYMARASADLRAWERWTGTAWLEAVERDRVLKALNAVIQRQLPKCRRYGLPENGVGVAEGEAIPPGYVRWAVTSAAASGDPAARARHYRSANRRLDVATEIRPTLRELLVSDPSDLPNAEPLQIRYGSELGGVLNVSGGYGQRRNVPDAEALWLLVACDMGMDCSEASVAADRLCLTRGLCGYPDLQSAVRDGLIGANEMAATMQARERIVAALRRGDIAALVDPAPAAPPARPSPQ